MNIEVTEALPALPPIRMGTANERALLKRAQRGSAEAFEELFRRNWSHAYRAAHLITGHAAAAEDIAQEAILASIRSLDQFDSRRPFGPWLHRITVNRAIDWARANRLRAVSELPAQEAARDARSELSDQVLDALRELPEEHRAVVALRYLLGYTPGQIAELLDLPRGTVNSRLRRALDRLRPVLEEQGYP